jgi:hypothetical protein
MRHYETNQNGETRIKLRKKDSDTGKNTTEWAYAPYISFSETAWGPLVSMLLGLLHKLTSAIQDLVKVPVNREKCQNATSENSSNSEIQHGKPGQVL